MNQLENEFYKNLSYLFDNSILRIINPSKGLHYYNKSNIPVISYNLNYNKITFKNNIWFKLKYKAYLFGLIKNENDFVILIKNLLERYFNIELNLVIYNYSKVNKFLGNSDCNISRIRCNGNTTRQIDESVQLLFEGYKVFIQDHYDMKDKRDNYVNNKRTLDQIVRRLKNEHPMLFDKKLIKIDRKKLTIELI